MHPCVRKDVYKRQVFNLLTKVYQPTHGTILLDGEDTSGKSVYQEMCIRDRPKAMLKITVDGLTGKLTWNDKGQVQKEPTAYVITDGKYVQA